MGSAAHVEAVLHLGWDPRRHGAPAWRFAQELRGFLGAIAREVSVAGQGSGIVRLSFPEGDWVIEVPMGGATAHLRLPVTLDWSPGADEPAHHLEPTDDAALPLLTLLGQVGAPSAWSLNNLVGLAAAVAPLASAVLVSPAPVVWSVEGPGQSLVAFPHRGCLSLGDGEPVLYVRGLPADDVPVPLVPARLPAEVSRAVPGALLRLVGEPDGVRVEIDPDATPEDRALALRHARAHLHLGHIAPGDADTHLDTRASIVTPQSRWDRAVYATDPETFAAARPASLDDCSPREKAVLGLWQVIGGMLGGTRPLHRKAQDYQKAAYQRQAAERLIAQLDTIGGAMLCDGVGLGKTYVATTLMVHYAAIWKEDHAEAFRISVLAPGSVVSTWLREALPPLGAKGVDVPTRWVRVISHSKLSRITTNSAILDPLRSGEESDFEHLALSDLVIIDEAHNFRSESAARTRFLRDLLAIQPRRERRRRVVLLTATPINNSLSDLEQELSLLFSEPVLISDAKTDATFHRHTATEIQRRAQKARVSGAKTAGVPGLLIHGDRNAKFSETPRFRRDMVISEGIQDLARYLRQQELRLEALQEEVRARAEVVTPTEPMEPVRIAEELLDRVVVQRSRTLCRRIEQQQGAAVELLFRRDADPPERLRYEDAYNQTTNVLARFLSLFGDSEGGHGGLSFKVHMWADVERGFKRADEAAPAIGLQKILALKRLESSPVAFLITLLRLTAQHAARLHELEERCAEAGLHQSAATLRRELARLLVGRPADDLRLLRWLCIGDAPMLPASGFFESLRRGAPSFEDDEPEVRQTELFNRAAPEIAPDTAELIGRLWELKDILLYDLAILLDAAPELARIVFGPFDPSAWPARFIAAAGARRWPASDTWASRALTDAKLRVLLRRLLTARRAGQKVVIFSQFKDTIAYLGSVLDAIRALPDADALEAELGTGLGDLLRACETLTGDTEDRDEVIDRFAPFYRIGPFAPPPDPTMLFEGHTAWERAWEGVVQRPIHALFATDILAEGVNLQDVSVLINYDIHWNPVRMIQRAGRVDRRLNPRIERAQSFPDVDAVAERLGAEPPRYGWQGRSDDAPVTVNLILPDRLENELNLRERIARKSLTIDVTLGLERGTGAEADWMDAYQWQGVAALSVYDRDRAIEELAGLQKELERRLRERGADPAWADELGAWLREEGVGEDAPLLARALLGRNGQALKPYTRWLEPALHEGVPCWLIRGPDGAFQRWLRLHGEERIADALDADALPAGPDAAGPLLASHVAPVARRLLDGELTLRELPLDLRVWQGLPAVAGARYFSEHDRAELDSANVFLLQTRKSQTC